MLIDARNIDNGSIIDSDICIIGAGAAGITIALEFMAKKSTSVVLLESGGLSLDPASQSLSGGEQVGLSYDDLEASRSRYLGGSTNCWGGWCRPLDDIDFEERDWIPDSGWPFRKYELIEYYERSHSLLQLRTFDYDLSTWEPLLKEKKLFPLTVGSERFANMVLHLSEPAKFGSLYRPDLKQATNVKLMVMANATEICTDHTGATVNCVRVATLNGKKFTVSAKVVILATGGIENARLLFLSNQIQTCGLGNGNDLVGRYFMDHPRIQSSRVRLNNPSIHRRLYDSRMVVRRDDSKDTRIALHWAPRAEWQRKLRIPNSRTYLASRYAHEMSDGYLALRRLIRLLRGYLRFGNPLEGLIREAMRIVPILLANAPGAAIGALGVLFNPPFLQQDFNFETVIEPIPNFDSRITLASSRDRLGLRRAKVDWRLTEADRLHFMTLHKMLVSDMLKDSALQLVGETTNIEEVWPGKIGGCWHHMGTTRMNADPAKGVVDPNCRVHGMSNLFIAGSSVFPTVGSDTPTITIVALALRLCGAIDNTLQERVLQVP
jgi:choline dehydrogenase-like flavoprotein